MDLWLSGFILFASLFLCSSAPTPEECEQLVKPLSFDDPSVMLGKKHVLAGYLDNEVFKIGLKITDSSWANITESPSSNTHLFMTQENKINGTCLSSSVNMTLDGDTAISLSPNTRSVSHLLPSCDGCLVTSSNITIKATHNILKLIKVNNVSETDDIHTRALYFLSRESTLKGSDLERFKKQARCLGYSGEPDYRYNPEKSFCQEGEGIKVQF